MRTHSRPQAAHGGSPQRKANLREAVAHDCRCRFQGPYDSRGSRPRIHNHAVRWGRAQAGLGGKGVPLATFDPGLHSR
jgi:hypothetical protein